MGAGLRERRLEREAALLEQVAAENPDLVEALGRERLPEADELRVRLFRSPALLSLPPGPLAVLETHFVTLRYPRFFPSMPIEAFLGRPVIHPNIDPVNGFVCLWGRNSHTHTVMEALRRLQRVMAWELVNEDSRHLMQPEALSWWLEAGAGKGLPLAYQALREVAGFRLEAAYSVGERRRRLEDLDT